MNVVSILLLFSLLDLTINPQRAMAQLPADSVLIPIELPVEFKPAPEVQMDASAVSPDCIAILDGSRPSDIPWNVNHASKCKVWDQGKLGSCWANSGVEHIALMLKHEGLLTPGDALSADYYTALSMKKQALRAFERGDKITLSVMDGSRFQRVYSFIMSAGTVKETEFSLPTFPIRAKENAPVTQVSLRNSAYYRREFENRLVKVTTEAELNLILTEYLGNTEQVKAIPTSAEVLKKYTPDLYANEANQDRRNFSVALEQSILYPIQEVPYEAIEKKITAAMDAGFVVQIGIRDYKPWIYSMRDFTTSFEEGVISEEQGLMDGHAVLLVGYHLDSAGDVDWYLLQNSWAKRFGMAGVASVSANFIKHHTKLYSIPNDLALAPRNH